MSPDITQRKLKQKRDARTCKKSLRETWPRPFKPSSTAGGRIIGISKWIASPDIFTIFYSAENGLYLKSACKSEESYNNLYNTVTWKSCHNSVLFSNFSLLLDQNKRRARKESEGQQCDAWTCEKSLREKWPRPPLYPRQIPKISQGGFNGIFKSIAFPEIFTLFTPAKMVFV